jgi:small subunit ribosomal protein S1
MNQEEKKVGLSIKAVGEEASRAEVESYKESNKGPKAGKGQSSSSSSSNSGSTTLGDLLNWKKSEREDNE